MNTTKLFIYENESENESKQNFLGSFVKNFRQKVFFDFDIFKDFFK